MFTSIRGRLLWLSLALLATLGTGIGVYLEGYLTDTLTARIGREITQQIKMAGGLLEGEPLTEARRQRLVDSLTQNTGGEVSLLPPGSPPSVGHQVGPVGQPMIQVTAPLRADGPVIQIAKPLDEVEAAISALWWLLLGIGLISSCVAFGMSLLAARLAARPLKALTREVEEVLHGAGAAQVIIQGEGEVKILAHAFNELLDQLRVKMQALAEERDRIGTVLEAMDGAVMALNAEQRISLVNPAARALLAFSVDPTGRTLGEITDIPELRALVAEVASAPRGERPLPLTAEFDLPVTPRRRVLARATEQPEGNGTVLLMQDVTALRHLERMRRDFVANVSHELRTPISVIRANAETLLDGAMERPDLARRFLEASLRNAERLSQLINDLLDISRIEAGRYRLDVTEIYLSEAVISAADSVEPKATAKGHVLNVDIPDDHVVMADPKALEQVLVNLLENAIKYTPDGGTITATAHHDGDSVRVDIVDDGPGIEAKYRARVFERFYRVDKGRSREMGGTGLGLSIVKNLIEAMKGRVGVEPAHPKGSIFWFRLPAAEAIEAHTLHGEPPSETEPPTLP